MRRLITLLAFALLGMALALYLVSIWFDWAPWLRGWKKYPDGWSWRFLETVPRWDRFLPAGLGLGIGALALLGLARRGTARSRWRIGVGLLVLVAGVHMLELGTLALKLSRPNTLLVNRILDEDFTGYFQAAQSVQSHEEFFTDWRRLMKACGHCTSHPTGASAFFWPLIRWAEDLPPELAESIAGRIQETFQVRTRNRTAAVVIAAFLNGQLILLLAALSVLPYYGLGRIISGAHQGGVIGAGLTATLPGLILMSPELDQVYVLISGLALLALLVGLRAARLLTTVLAGLACGLCMAVGLFLTWGLLLWLPLLACVTGAFVLGFHVVWNGHAIPIRQRLTRSALSCTAVLAGLGIPYLLLSVTTPYDVRDVARQGLGHYQTFEAIGRPGGAVWLIHGPLDTAQFTGLPLALAAICQLVASAGLPVVPWSRRCAASLGRINVYSVALIGIVAVTFLGGYMKAESGRQLLFIMPLAVLAITSGMRHATERLAPWHWLLFVAQAFVTVVIGARWITP